MSNPFDVTIGRQWKLQELLDIVFRLFLQIFSFHWNKTKLFFFPPEDNTSAVSKYPYETVVQEMISQTEAVMEGEEGPAMH